MASDIRRGSLVELDMRALTEAFNAAYDGYFVPLRFTLERMAEHVLANDVRLEHSPLWRDAEGAFAALALLATRGERGWIGGFGIAIRHRGQGWGHELVAEVLERARRLGLRRLQLEVLEQNRPAIAVYERAGFVHTRDLCSYRAGEVHRGIRPSQRVVSIEPRVALELEPTHPPAWQREHASLLQTTSVEALGLGAPEAPEAAIVYRLTPTGLHILGLFAPDEDSGAILLDAACAQSPDGVVVLMNEPAESPLDQVVRKRTWIPSVRQHEMHLEL